MTASEHDVPVAEMAGSSAETDSSQNQFSRREVLQLAGGAASLAVPGAVAQAASPLTQETARWRACN